MNWAQSKDPVYHMCLAGTVVASWSLSQEVTGSNPFTVMTNIFVTEFTEFRVKTFRKNTTDTYQREKYQGAALVHVDKLR